jgi:hypothetical protein
VLAEDPQDVLESRAYAFLQAQQGLRDAELRHQCAGWIQDYLAEQRRRH